MLAILRKNGALMDVSNKSWSLFRCCIFIGDKKEKVYQITRDSLFYVNDETTEEELLMLWEREKSKGINK